MIQLLETSHNIWMHGGRKRSSAFCYDMPFEDFSWRQFNYNYQIPHDSGHHYADDMHLSGHHYADDMYLSHQMSAHYADDMYLTHQRAEHYDDMRFLPHQVPEHYDNEVFTTPNYGSL